MQLQAGHPGMLGRSTFSSKPLRRRAVLVSASKLASRTDTLRELLKGPQIIKVCRN